MTMEELKALWTERKHHRERLVLARRQMGDTEAVLIFAREQSAIEQCLEELESLET